MRTTGSLHRYFFVLALAGTLPAATYHIGRGQPGDPATPSEFNWASALQDGDTVKIYCRQDPYRSKWTLLFNARGTALKNVTIEGVATAACQRPVIDGSGARPPLGQGESWIGGAFNRSILQIGEPGWVKPEAITVRNLEFTGTIAASGAFRPTQYWTEYNNGVLSSYASNAAALRVFGKDITIENCKISFNPNGLFVGSKSGSTQLSGAAENIIVRNSHFFRNAPVGQVHQIYAECSGILVENSLFEQAEPTDGNNIKDRCSGSVYRYNRVVGGNMQFDFVQSAIPIINGAGNAAARDRYDTIFLYGNVIVRLQSPNPNMIHLGFDGTSAGGECYQLQATNCAGTGRRNLFAYHNAFISSEGLSNLFTLSSGAQFVDARNNYVVQRSVSAGSFSIAESYGYAWPARVDWYGNAHFDDSASNPNGTRFLSKASADAVAVAVTAAAQRTLAEFSVPGLNSLPLPNLPGDSADQMLAASLLSFQPTAGSLLAAGTVPLPARAYEINPMTGAPNAVTMQFGYPGALTPRQASLSTGPFDAPTVAPVPAPSPSTPPASCTSLSSGPVSGLAGYWKLDEESGLQSLDAAGISAPGSLVGSPARTARGKFCGALLFSGANQYVDLGNSFALSNVQSVTVSAWYKPSLVNDGQALVVWDSGSHDLYRLSVKDSGTPSLMGPAFGVRTAAGQRSVWANKQDWDPARWYLLTGVFNGVTKDLEIYLDGARLQSLQLPGESLVNSGYGSQRVFLAGEPGANAAGGIDDVRIYARALTAAEIAGLSGTSPMAPSSLVGHWKLDESNGVSVTDASSTGTTGTLSGSATWSPGGGRLNGALMLSGSGYADLGAPPALANLSSITVSAWYKPSGANDVRDLIVWDSGSFDYFKLSIKDSGTASLMGAWFSIQAATGEQKSVPLGKAEWNPSVWYHLAGTFDDSSKLLRIYLNGALAGSVTLPGVQMKRGPWGTQRAYLGGEPGAGLRGAMDDVRVYNRALSSAEVNLLFQGGNP